MLAGRPIWINIVLRSGGYHQRAGPWMAFNMIALTPPLTILRGFTWRLHEGPFWRTLRIQLLAIAVNADLMELAP
ncbi:hypothetical protein AMK68_00205 [candidate division KD3-62 bacterium DG_56]|uniref:Uncharacterized protein n=1 Tax=candidate division KD3-62 bacterium DG_56 TaxID=1704032 RepID=A0A0S7XR42_9BACT|nr:MAG: hypothetical protein AMK68_00205 [candidate division KD3-62 bacterium DG_56]